jgi:D-alanyl-D-alanine-carboxypeptidase/D-alanyl-D-alanine-endopeptidase
MKKSFKLFYLLFLFTAYSAISIAQLPIDSIKKIIKTEVDNKRSKGIVVGIITEKGTQVVGYGKVKDDSNQQPDGNTLYEIGSMTKVFTSLILADMVQKGELKLDDPISKFLPKTVKTPTRNGKEITLLDLATHTSGLPSMPDNIHPKDPNNLFADYTVEQLYDFISKYKLTRDIGSKFEYSNIGVGLLGHILTLKAGKDYETLVRERICIPLNMNKTIITLTPELKSILATGHDIFGNPMENNDFPAVAGMGALRSNVNDLLLFLSANLGFTKTTLSSAMEQTHISRDSKGSPNLEIGLAWLISKKTGTEIISHGGVTFGYNTFFGFDKKKKIGVVVLSNSYTDIEEIAICILESKLKQLTPFHYHYYLIDTIAVTINEKGINAAIKLYHSLKKEKNSRFSFDEEQLNLLGYSELNEKKVKEAVAILKLNSEEYPASGNVFDSYGEACAINGDTALAIKNYEKSIKINPYNNSGIETLNKLKSKYFHKDYSLLSFTKYIPKDLDKYLGVYSSKQFPLKITVTKNDSTLIAQATGQPSFPLEATEKDKFKYDQAGIIMEFNTDKNELTLKQAGRSVLFTKDTLVSKDNSLPTVIKSTYKLKKEDMDKYLGVYSSSQFPLKITVTKNDSTIIAQATGQSSFPLDATEKDKFQFEQAGIIMEFNTDKNELTLKQGGGTFLFTKDK